MEAPSKGLQKITTKFKKTISKIQKEIFKKVVSLWEKYQFLCNLISSVFIVSLYYLGYLSNIRENTGSFISYGTALVTLNGVFLTLLVTLKESEIFKRIRQYFPELHSYLYTGLKNQVKNCIIFIVLNLFIASFGPVENLYLVAIGVSIWAFFLSDITFGAIYNLRVVTNLTTDKGPNNNKPME